MGGIDCLPQVAQESNVLRHHRNSTRMKRQLVAWHVRSHTDETQLPHFKNHSQKVFCCNLHYHESIGLEPQSALNSACDIADDTDKGGFRDTESLSRNVRLHFSNLPQCTGYSQHQISDGRYCQVDVDGVQGHDLAACSFSPWWDSKA
jgi:hypothetical protein